MKIAVLMTVWSVEYITYLYQGFMAYAKEHPVTVDLFACFGKIDMVDVTNQAQYRFLQFPDLKQYDGIIVPMVSITEHTMRMELLWNIRASGKPCISIEEKLDGMSWIGIDQYRAMQELVFHMVKKHGASRFCYVGGTAGTFEAQTRRQAFMEALSLCGLTLEPEWNFSEFYQYEDGYKIGQRILDAHARGCSVPDTVVCANDEMAVGVCDALYGSVLWGSVRVSGFDQYFLGQNYSPSLTTVARPKEQMAYESCRMMEQLIKEGGTLHMEMQYTLFCGQTCGCDGECVIDEKDFRRRSLYREHRRTVMEDRLHYMEERITKSHISWEAIGKEIEHVLEEFGCSRCKIVLSDKLLNGKTATDYRECTEVKLDWRSPSQHAQEGGCVHLYLPLHFQQRIMGYCYLEHAYDLLDYAVAESFIKTICFSLENYIQKKQYAEINKKYLRLYMTDQLTGIYNRFGLGEYGGQLFDKNRREHRDTQIIFYDINRLKYINDTFGHKAGDRAICIVGEVLAGMRADDCLPFRYGGDEFILIAGQSDGVDRIRQFKEALKKHQAGTPEEFGEVEVSAGEIIAPWDADGSLEKYFIQADKVMYEEKLRYHRMHD